MSMHHDGNTPFLFVISPTKTMRLTSEKGRDLPAYEPQAERLLGYLRQFDEPTLQSFLQVNTQLAQLNHQRLHAPSPEAMAIDAYHGAQFKALDSESLSLEARLYLQEKLRILSGLYGALKPFDRIRLYRLPMALRVDKVKLSDFWRPVISPEFEPFTVVNLASKEYIEALDTSRITVIEIRFQEKNRGTLKTKAMDAKRLRGQMVRYAATHTIKDLNDLQAFQADGYRYDAAHSTSNIWTFTK